MTGTTVLWSFSVDEDGCVVAARDPVGEEDTRLAVEVFIDPFGLSPDRAETYAREWQRSYSRCGADYVLGTASAAARRTSADSVVLEALYGQFRDCVLDVDEFEGMLAALSGWLRSRRGSDTDLRLPTDDTV